MRVKRETTTRRVPEWMAGDGDALGQAVTFVLIPVLFGLFGRWLDRQLSIEPIATLLFVVVGFVGVFVSFYYRYQARMAELEKGKPWARKA